MDRAHPVKDLEEHHILAEFATGYQHTRVVGLPDGRIHWQRSPGPNHPGEYDPVRPGFIRRAHAASDQHIRFAVPVTGPGTGCTWEVTGSHSAAEMLLSEDDPTGVLHESIAALGRQLHALHHQHASNDPMGDYPPPPGPARLMTWLENGLGPRACAGWHHRLRTQLGSSRWEKLRDFTDHMLNPQPSDTTTVVHGWFSLGSIVVADAVGSGPDAVVLSGLEAAQGRPEIDLACLIGELAEFSQIARRQGRERAVLHTLGDRFLAHYGSGWDRDSVAAGAVVRIATHARDFAAYIGWHADLHSYAPMLADLLDSDGASALATA